MDKYPSPRDADRVRSTSRALLVAALGSGACQPRSAAPAASDAAPLATVLSDASLTVLADASSTEPPLPVPDAGPPEPRTLYLGPRATLADLCADADAWYAKMGHRPRSKVCLIHGPRTLSGDRFLEAADYAIPAPPHPFSERPANQYEPFLALRTTQGWFAQPIDSFPMGFGRTVWIPLDRIAERDGELVVVHLETRNGKPEQTEERELHCALSDAGAPSCTSFTLKADSGP